MTRKRTPTVLQMEAVECGAAALGILLGYFGHYRSLEELRIACGISRDGSKANNILKAASNYGLEADGFQAELSELKEINDPFIVFWEFNHFIVVEGFKKDNVFINDPATGPRTIPLAEFSDGFTGVVLIMRPGKHFIKTGSPPGIKQSLTKRLRSNYNAVALITLLSLFLIVPGIIIPGFSKIFIDNILINEMRSWFAPLIIGMIGVALLQTLLVFLQRRFLLKLRMKMMLSMNAGFTLHLIKLPLQFFYQRFAGDIVDRVNANERIADLLSSEISGSAISLFGMFFFAIILFIISWPLALISISFAAINFSLLFKVSRNIADVSRDMRQKLGQLSGFEMTAISNIEAIKSSASGDDFFKRWAGYHANIINAQQRIALFNQLLLIIPRLLNLLLIVIVLGLGSYLIIKGKLTVGSVVAFQALLINFNQPLMALLNVGNRLQQIRGDLMRVDDVFNYPQTPTTETDIQEMLKPTIQVTHLSFGYSPLEPPLFNDINLSIKAGSSIAIVGKTGSGKSTLAKLLCNLYQPWNGEVLIGDHPIKTLSTEKLAQVLSYVDQDIFLFEGTIRQNLALWDQNISDEALMDAMRITEIDSFISGRGGLDAMVTERGSNFSGGQRQLIEITRALVSKPKILILDEASANLDVEIEELVINKLKALNLTLIAITHRLQSIKDFDEVIVIDSGQIVEAGPPQFQ